MKLRKLVQEAAFPLAPGLGELGEGSLSVVNLNKRNGNYCVALGWPGFSTYAWREEKGRGSSYNM
jgi:hypothetical protein